MRNIFDAPEAEVLESRDFRVLASDVVVMNPPPAMVNLLQTYSSCHRERHLGQSETD